MTTETTTAPAADDELAFGRPIDPGTYRGIVLSVEPARIETDEGPKDLLRWTFAVDVDGHGEEIDALSSRATSPRSKPYAWVTALLGRIPEPGERLKLGKLAGLSALVSIELDDNNYPKVGGLMALPKGTKPTPAA